MIVLCIVFILVADVNVLAQTSYKIETHPVLPENKLATNFSGLQLSTYTSYTSRYNRSGPRCQWEFGNRSPIVLLDRGYNNANCRNTTGSYYISNCVERNGGMSATLIITDPIEASIFVRLRCRTSHSFYSQIAWINITVADCSSDIEGVVVDSASANYYSTGRFRCTNGGTLFYSNGTQPTSTQTNCLATAEWSGQDDFQCWLVPNATISGHTTVIEGDDLTLSCDYDDVMPIGNQSAFYFGDIAVKLNKGCDLTMPSLKRSDNDKMVSCQALTPFNEIDPDSGRSKPRTVKVLYEPYQDKPTVCTWMANTSQICKILFNANSYQVQTYIEVKQVIKDGSVVQGILSPVLADGPRDAVAFHFGLFQDVTMDDAGRYEVQLTSVVPPKIHSIHFDVVVVVESNCNSTLV